jgi:hypothetical protein
MAYTTRAIVKRQLGIEDADTSLDTLIDEAIEDATDVLNGELDRTFEASGDTTRYFHAVKQVSADKRTLYLDCDICQITSLKGV